MSLADLWKKLSHQSLLKKHLTPERYEKLKNQKTSLGGTLKECIQSGVAHPQSNVGIYASDPEAYTVFADVLDPIILDYHNVQKVSHPAPDFGNLDNLGLENPDPEGKYIVSTRVRVGRSLEGYGFPPTSSEEGRKEIETKAVEALNSLDGELKGKYYSLETMTPAENQQLIKDHFMFKNDDGCLNAAGGYNGWPVARGIFFNPAKNFLVWVNEEDHLRLISMQKGGDLANVYKRLVTAVKKMETLLKFAHLPQLGYLTFCPTNLGTTMRASVHIRIPKFSQDPEFKNFCDKYHLQARGTDGEHTASVGGVYDISNQRRLGLSEIQALTEMHTGVKALIQEEKKRQ